VVEAVVLDGQDAPVRRVPFTIVHAALAGDRIHLELTPSPGVDPAIALGRRAELLVVHEGRRLALPPATVESDGRILAIGSVPELRGRRDGTLDQLPAQAIGLALLPPGFLAES
jgi:hypothetical protein